ncbi:MAG TPA: hypothetical protein VGL61_14860 [Kofleriaceae bacterium]|jgi:hypothetical protein
MKSLENLRTASPCHADWNDMTGDERVRRCAACAKPVFNLSEMTRAEAEQVIADRNGNLCARYYQRKDGTILLADCTVGGSGAKARSFVLATALAAGAAYAKLHRGPAPASAPIDTAANHDAPNGAFSSAEHEAPPPAPRPHPIARVHVHHVQPPPDTMIMMGDIDVRSSDELQKLTK